MGIQITPGVANQRFTVQFPLITEHYQEDILNKRFEIACHLYNSMLLKIQRRLNEMRKTKAYRTTREKLTAINARIYSCGKEEQKALHHERAALRHKLKELRALYRISDNDFQIDIRPMQHHFTENIDCATAQRIASRLWNAARAVLFSGGQELRCKEADAFNSLESKSTESGIKFKEEKGIMVWRGLKIPVKVDYGNPYEAMAMEHKVKYCRIVRIFVRGKYKFYIQVVFEGLAPPKIDKSTGELKHSLGKGDVGLDIGVQTLAVASSTDVKLFELADKVRNIDKEKRYLRRRIDRSRRGIKPDNRHEDGTAKAHSGRVNPKPNTGAHNKLRELHRKQAAIRRMQHHIMANALLPLGEWTSAD